jgi:hypothetical protein
MKKLMLLMGLLLVTSLSFSQTVTKEEKMVNQDTIVSLKVPIAKLVIKDLIKGDGASLQVKELGNVVKLKDEQILLLKQKDTLQNQKISNLETIILKKDEQFSLEREKSEKLLKELKGQRAKTFLFKVGTFVGIVATSVLLIQR